MKAVFLDVDGVVRPFKGDKVQAQACAQRVHKLVKMTGAQVVMSSSWRFDAIKASHDWRVAHQTPAFSTIKADLRRDAGLRVNFIGVTPDLFDQFQTDPHSCLTPDGLRAHEIRAWLAEHPEVTDWVVLDDIAEWLDAEMMPHTVLTDSKVGFSEADLAKALGLLGVPQLI